MIPAFQVTAASQADPTLSTEPERPLRVLVLAEAANPEWTSVPLVGWSHARALARHADTHLVTHVRNVDAIERAGLRAGDDYTALDTERVAAPVWHVQQAIQKLTGAGWTLNTALATVRYYDFERLAWRRFQAALERGEYDVVHRLTPLSPTIPSTIAGKLKRIDVPFVWGPINGGFPYPPGFTNLRRSEGEWLTIVRRGYELLPGYRDTRRHANALVVASSATFDQMPEWAKARCVYLPENAVDPTRFSAPGARPTGLPLRLAFIGRLVPYKALDIALDAAAPLLRDGRARFEVFGDGPEREKLVGQAARLGVADAVHFAGWVDHAELGARLSASNVFCFPSLREFGGGVVLEAMALGLVPIVADYAGPRELVTDETGYRVPVTHREGVVAGVRERLERLAREPELLETLGARARERVARLFSWDAKALQMREVYRWVLGRRSKPDFGMPLERTGPES